MSRGSALTDPALLAALESRRSLRVDDYHRMVQAGVFDEDDRLELLEGVIVEMSPQSPRHALAITRLCDPQFAPIGPDCVARAQLPLTLEPDSEPEPDVAIVRRAASGDRHRHPSTALAVFEVASDSLRKDRLAKAALYARAGIPEYVIVNLVQDTLEVHREPDREGRRYRSVATLSGAEVFASASVPGYGFVVADLLA